MSTETKELKAEWKAETVLPEYTLKDVATHNTKGDTWMVIHGQGENAREDVDAKLTIQQSSILQSISRTTPEAQRC